MQFKLEKSTNSGDPTERKHGRELHYRIRSSQDKKERSKRKARGTSDSDVDVGRIACILITDLASWSIDYKKNDVYKYRTEVKVLDLAFIESRY